MSSIGGHEEAPFEVTGRDFDAEVAMADDGWAEEATEADTDSVTYRHRHQTTPPLFCSSPHYLDGLGFVKRT